jgi:hypothetical protein
MPQGQLTVDRMCRLAGVSRAGYYRHWATSAPLQEETAIRDAVQRAALANRRYGYRRIAAQLRRDGLVVNHKRVLRLMRKDNLLCLRRRPFVPITTDSRHEWRVVPNLARGLLLSGLDQLWVADITYVRLLEEFAFLAVVLDADAPCGLRSFYRAATKQKCMAPERGPLKNTIRKQWTTHITAPEPCSGRKAEAMLLGAAQRRNRERCRCSAKSPARSPGLRTKKPDLGQARDRSTLRQFQFHEWSDSYPRVKNKRPSRVSTSSDLRRRPLIPTFPPHAGRRSPRFAGGGHRSALKSLAGSGL